MDFEILQLPLTILDVQAEEEANAWANFHNCQNKLGKLGQQIVREKEMDEMIQIEKIICNITHEVEQLREIKDIKDELRMIKRVLDDQRIVIDKYHDGQREREEVLLPGDEAEELALMKKDLEFRISTVESLSANASSVEDSVRTVSTRIPQ